MAKRKKKTKPKPPMSDAEIIQAAFSIRDGCRKLVSRERFPLERFLEIIGDLKEIGSIVENFNGGQSGK